MPAKTYTTLKLLMNTALNLSAWIFTNKSYLWIFYEYQHFCNCFTLKYFGKLISANNHKWKVSKLPLISYHIKAYVSLPIIVATVSRYILVTKPYPYLVSEIKSFRMDYLVTPGTRLRVQIWPPDFRTSIFDQFG